jgi:hypothetical protein
VIEKILICFSLCIFSAGTYLVWFSKRNIFNHMSIGVCLVAYIIPVCVLDFSTYASNEVVELYTLINIVGVCAFIPGLLLGYKWKQVMLVDVVTQFGYINKLPFRDNLMNRFAKVTDKIYIIGVIGLIISYMAMGFLPMFAADPFSAKFFKGDYQASYTRVAFIYRTSRQFIELVLPFKMLQVYIKPSTKNIFLIGVGLLLIIVSLNRATMFSGLLLAMSIVIALKRNNWSFFLYVFTLITIVVVGSSLYYIVGILSPDGFFGDLNLGNNFFEAIAFGSPDITDQLNFLTHYINTGSNLTYGLTFIGGLIPFNFKYNPSAWTLYILNETDDISNISSGGLRMPVSIWGYISFGWVGVVLVPFISAFFTGYITKKIKRMVSNYSPTANSYLPFFFVAYLYLNISTVFITFYYISIYSLPAFVIYYVLISLGKRSKPSVPAEPSPQQNI